MSSIENIKKIGVLPVIKIEDPETAVPLADALIKGGINAIEVTLRNDTALQALSLIKQHFPQMTVGAGTVIYKEQVDEAVDAGADFIVSPGFNRKNVEYCIENGIETVPGCSNASEIDAAFRLGLRTVKFFPAEALGGVSALKLYNGPYSAVKFIPTGGISFDNLEKYLRTDCVAACGGSFLAKSDQIRSHDWETVTENCRRAVKQSLGFELAHIGINNGSETSAHSNAEALRTMLGATVTDGEKSIFCDETVELMKSNGYGQNGHIGYYTNSVYRAKAWFERQGISICEESIMQKTNGDLLSFYLKEEIGGFAIHVVARK